VESGSVELVYIPPIGDAAMDGAPERGAVGVFGADEEDALAAGGWGEGGGERFGGVGGRE
jgi:hypothetical protein